MTRTLITLTVLLALCPALMAADDPAPVALLKPGDVDRFCKTFPELTKQIEELGAKYEAKTGDVSGLAALQASAEFKALLTKHGWNETFYQKLAVIAQGYAHLRYGQAMKDARPKMEKSMRELEKTQGLSPEMIAQLQGQMKAAMQSMEQAKAQMKASLHPQDLALIKQHLDRVGQSLGDDSKKP